MAKKNLKWTVNESLLSCELGIGVDKETLTFDLTKIFPNFAELNEVQQKTIINGIKQKLADSLARNDGEQLSPEEMVSKLTSLWNQLSVDRKWTSGDGGFQSPGAQVNALIAKSFKALGKAPALKDVKTVAPMLGLNETDEQLTARIKAVVAKQTAK